MAKIKEKVFYGAISKNMKKSQNIVEKYMASFISQLFKEMNRGNEVHIKNFGIFSPKLFGGRYMYVCGEKKYIEPRIVIDFSLTSKGLQILNNMTLDKNAKEELKNNLLSYEKEIIEKPIKKRKDLKEVFDKVVNNKKEEFTSGENEKNDA